MALGPSVKDKNKALLIVNPAAGQSSATAFAKKLCSALDGLDPCVFYIKDAQSKVNLATLLNQSPGFRVAFILGGDGTLFHILPLLEKYSLPIIPVPVGSANDLATEFGVTLDAQKIIERLNRCDTEKIDLLSVNSQHFATVAGVGIGAKVVQSFNASRSEGVFSSFARKICAKNFYKLLVLQNAFHTDSFTKKYRIHINGCDHFFESSGVFISNTKKLGQDMTMCDSASLQDGVFEVMVAPKLEPYALLKSLLSLSKGIIPSSFHSLKGAHCRIESIGKKGTLHFADGEDLGIARVLDYTCLPSRLTVFQ